MGGVLYTLRSGTNSYTHENRRGDVIAKTDDSGSLTYQAAYQAFGTRTQENGSTPDRQKANTKDEDPTGLLNEGFRYRDEFVFLTKDPAGFVDGPNLYCYVRQNPWTSFDPEGLKIVIREMTPDQKTAFDAMLAKAKKSPTFQKEWKAAQDSKQTIEIGMETDQNRKWFKSDAQHRGLTTTEMDDSNGVKIVVSLRTPLPEDKKDVGGVTPGYLGHELQHANEKAYRNGKDPAGVGGVVDIGDPNPSVIEGDPKEREHANLSGMENRGTRAEEKIDKEVGDPINVNHTNSFGEVLPEYKNGRDGTVIEPPTQSAPKPTVEPSASSTPSQSNSGN